MSVTQAAPSITPVYSDASNIVKKSQTKADLRKIDDNYRLAFMAENLPSKPNVVVANLKAALKKGGIAAVKAEIERRFPNGSNASSENARCYVIAKRCLVTAEDRLKAEGVAISE